MKYASEDLDSSMKDISQYRGSLFSKGGRAGLTCVPGQYAAVVAALSVATSSAAIQQMNYDDILAISRPFAKNPRTCCALTLQGCSHLTQPLFPTGFSYDWIMEIVRMLKIAVDYSEEAHHDQLVRNNNLQLCLSILNHLGFQGELQPRSFGGKFAMLALNVRNIVILISIASNTPPQMKDKLNPLDEPGKPHRWSTGSLVSVQN